MASSYDESLQNFDLNFLSNSKDPSISELYEKTRKQLKILKSKVVGTDAMIREYFRLAEETKVVKKTDLDSKQELRNTYIKLKDATDECTKLENENKIYKTKADEYQKQATHFEDQYKALKSHSNQLQILVKELETQIDGLSLEKQLEASNIKETVSKLLTLQKDNEAMFKDILTLKELVLGKRKIGKVHLILLRKYERDKSKDDNCTSDESNNEADDFDNPVSPLDAQTSSEIINNTADDKSEESVLPNILDAAYDEVKGHHKQSYIEHDSDHSHEMASIDTGRGSSRTNSYEKCLSSPDYFITIPIHERTDIINRDRSNYIDVANSPITVNESTSIATSPIIFNDVTFISVATSPIRINDFPQSQECLDNAKHIIEDDLPICTEAATIIGKNNKLVDACTSPILASESPHLIYRGNSHIENDTRTTHIMNSSFEKNSNQSEVNQIRKSQKVKLRLIENISKSTAPSIVVESSNSNRDAPISKALEKECLERHNSYNICSERNNCEIEHILKTMKFNYELITPLPKTPLSNTLTSITSPKTLTCKTLTPITPPVLPESKITTPETLSITPTSKPLISITQPIGPTTTPPMTDSSISDTERIINLEIKSAFYEEKFTKVFADLEMLKKAIRVQKNRNIKKSDNRDNWDKKVINTQAISNDLNTSRNEESDDDILEKETVNVEEGNLQTQQVTHNVELHEECGDDIRTSSTEKTTTDVIEDNTIKSNMHVTIKSNIAKKRKASKLEKLRQKIIPAGKIKRAASPPISKKVTQLKAPPFAIETDLISLKNKVAFENAVKVMAEIKSKQTQNETLETKSTSNKNQNHSRQESEGVTLGRNLNCLDASIQPVSKMNQSESIYNIPCLTAGEMNRNVTVNNIGAPAMPACFIDQNSSINKEVPVVPVGSMDQNLQVHTDRTMTQNDSLICTGDQKHNDHPPFSPNSNIDKNELLSSNIRRTRSITRRLSKKEEDVNLSVSPQKIGNAEDNLKSPEISLDKRRGRKRHSIYAEDNLLNSCKRVLGKSCHYKIVEENVLVQPLIEGIRKLSGDDQEIRKQVVTECALEISNKNSIDSDSENPVVDINVDTTLSKTSKTTETSQNEPIKITDVKNKYLVQSHSSAEGAHIANRPEVSKAGPAGKQINQKEYINSPKSSHRDNANHLHKEPVVELVPLRAEQIKNVQHTVIDYGDLNMYAENTDQLVHDEATTELRRLRDNVLCTALDKYGVISVKYTAKKIPDEIKNRVVRIIEDGIAQVTSQPKDNQKTAMNDLLKSLQSHSTKHILSGLMVYLKDAARKLELFSKATTASAPPMTKPEIILLYVIEQLNNSSAGDFIHQVWNNIEHTLFQLGRTPHFDVIESLSHFYAVMSRYFRNKSRLRCFMLDAMYCLQFKAIPLIRQCLDVCPFVLPQAHERLAKSSLVTCLVYLLHFYKCEDKFNRAQDIRNILQRKYSYSFSEWNETMILEIFRKAIMDLRGTQNDKKMLRIALILLCKRNGAKWCEANIIQNMLMPIIDKREVSEKIKAFSILMLGPLLKPFPADRKLQCEIVTNQLHRILEQNPSHIIQEAIYSSLIFMSKHDQDRVVQALLSWNPPHVSPEFEKVLNDYVMEKPLKVWKNLLARKAISLNT